MRERDHSRVCEHCGRRVQTRIPAGGDGSREQFIRHRLPRDENGQPGARCVGSGLEAPLRNVDD